MIFGGAMHADQDDKHPWLREENFFLQRLLDLHIPVLGVCLGAQLIAKAAHAEVSAMAEPEVGWVDVELTEEAADDPLFEGLPDRFPSFQWHYYEFTPPTGAQVLARSDRCPRRSGWVTRSWGVQFHPEVNRPILEEWLGRAPDELPGTADEILAAYDRQAGRVGEVRSHALRQLRRGRRAGRRNRLARGGQVFLPAPLVPGAHVVSRAVAGSS